MIVEYRLIKATEAYFLKVMEARNPADGGISYDLIWSFFPHTDKQPVSLSLVRTSHLVDDGSSLWPHLTLRASLKALALNTDTL